jgi:hypothetical protein
MRFRREHAQATHETESPVEAAQFEQRGWRVIEEIQAGGASGGASASTVFVLGWFEERPPEYPEEPRIRDIL